MVLAPHIFSWAIIVIMKKKKAYIYMHIRRAHEGLWYSTINPKVVLAGVPLFFISETLFFLLKRWIIILFFGTQTIRGARVRKKLRAWCVYRTRSQKMAICMWDFFTERYYYAFADTLMPSIERLLYTL